MPPVRSNRPYTLIASHYDALFTFHRRWFDRARRRLLGKSLRRARLVCDLGCGTGEAALAVARHGKQVFAVDLSPTMCRLAREKARSARLPVRVLRADMRDFRLPEPVDLVLCEFDALNHVPRKSDLARVAQAVARALKPGGYFYFDVNNRAAFQKLWPGCAWLDRPDLALVLHGGYDARRDNGWTIAEWFVRKGRYWKRSRERIDQVCWSPAEIRRALRRAGFEKIRSADGAQILRGYPWVRPGSRTFYVARRKNPSRD